MTEKAKLDPLLIPFFLGLMVIVIFGAYSIVKHGDNLVLKYQLADAKAELDSTKFKSRKQKADDSSVILKLQERLKTVEGAASSLQEVLKHFQETLERVETYSKAAALRKPKQQFSEPVLQTSEDLIPTRTPPLSDNWVFTQTGYIPGYHDTIYVKPPMYYYYKMEYGEWPLYNVRKPSWIGLGPSIGTAVTVRGDWVTYIGVGINFNLLRFR